MEEKLRKVGFELGKFDNFPEEVWVCVTSGSDRFRTYFVIYLDDLSKLWINQLKTGGLRTVSQKDILRNTNDTCTNACNQLQLILKELPELAE